MSPADVMVGMILGFSVAVALVFLALCPDPPPRYRSKGG